MEGFKKAINFVTIAVIFYVSVSLLAACGGSGGGSGTNGGDGIQGTFLDAAVDGLTYTTPSSDVAKTTQNGGQFSCNDDDTVTFSVGDVILGQVPCQEIVTPLDLAEATDVNDPVVTNIARFLQSLDSDPSDDRININPATATEATGRNIDIANPSLDFDTDADVQALFTALGINPVSEVNARIHLQASLDKINAPAYSNATLNGTYSGAFFRETMPDQGQTVSGFYDIIIDGTGQGTSTGKYSMSFYAANQEESGLTTYTMNTDGTFVLGDDYDGSWTTNPEGSFMISSNVSNPTEGQTLGVYARRGSTVYSEASLNGTYHFSYISHVVGTPDSYYSAYGAITFDGAGNFVLNGFYTKLGASANTNYSDSGTYNVTADGTITLTNSDPSTFIGSINSKGDFISMANVSEVNEQEIMYILKSSDSGYTDSSLNGDFYIGRFSYQSAQRKSCNAIFSFSNGSYTGSGVCSDSSGATDTPFSFGPYDYIVNDDGTFVADEGGGQFLSGAISPDGKTIILSQVNETNKADILIGVKK